MSSQFEATTRLTQVCFLFLSNSNFLDHARMQSSTLYSTFIVLLCGVSLAYSLQCYVCSSEDKEVSAEKPCGIGKPHASYMMNCTDAPKTLGGQLEPGKQWSLCRKIVTWVDYDINDSGKTVERVLRKCGYDNEKHSETCFYRGGLGGRQRVCSCKGDNCNSAPKTSMNLITMLGVFIPVFIVTLFQ